MRIYYIANSRIPTERAHGLQISKTCEAIAAAGHTVTLIVPRRKNTVREDVFSYYSIKRNFSIVYLPVLDLVKYGKIGFLIEQFSFALASIFYLLRAPKADIHYFRDETIALFLLPFQARTIWETHTGAWNGAARIVAKRCAKIIAISSGLKDFYIQKGISEKKIAVAHDGVDLETFAISTTQAEARKKLGLPVESRIAMYIGLLEESKGIHTILKSAEYVTDGIIGIIGGDEKTISVLQQQYPAKSILFLGYQPYRELPINQKAADVLVIPNSKKNIVSNLFTSPLKVFAHMASGVPIVASNIPSLCEILNENNCILVEADDPKALAAAINELFNNPQKGNVLAEKAKNDVEQYSWNSRAAIIIKAFSNV